MTAEGGGALLGVLVGFGRALRAAGVAVGPGDVTTFCAALRPLDPGDLVDLYWAGRTTLVTRREDIAVYDEVFRAHFLGERDPLREAAVPRSGPGAEAGAVVDVPAVPAADDPEEDEPGGLGEVASSAEALRHKAFAACTPDELRALRRIMAQVRLTPPRRRTRRHRSAAHGRRPDLRRTVRDSLRLHGEPVPLRHRRRRVRLRPLVLVLDVSGSMTPYSRALLQFAHSARRGAGPAQRVEVFCFGTRLTRITVPLQKRSPDVALAEAAALVVDWEGGTRIGASLEEFVRLWGRRGVGRGAVVVICSDGLDRGDPDVLDAALARLSRQCHRIVWCNPLRGDDPAARPTSMGMMVAGPHIDLLLSGHDLGSLTELAALLPELA
ncbi:MAG: VWA domain-containing protein [Pseudonocardiales bacterium]|nr:VWA domain-containing protein [Pseudonocardiales bacterium]